MENDLDSKIEEFLDVIEDITNCSLQGYQKNYLTIYIKNMYMESTIPMTKVYIDRTKLKGLESNLAIIDDLK